MLLFMCFASVFTQTVFQLSKNGPPPWPTSSTFAATKPTPTPIASQLLRVSWKPPVPSSRELSARCATTPPSKSSSPMPTPPNGRSVLRCASSAHAPKWEIYTRCTPIGSPKSWAMAVSTVRNAPEDSRRCSLKWCSNGGKTTKKTQNPPPLTTGWMRYWRR